MDLPEPEGPSTATTSWRLCPDTPDPLRPDDFPDDDFLTMCASTVLDRRMATPHGRTSSQEGGTSHGEPWHTHWCGPPPAGGSGRCRPGAPGCRAGAGSRAARNQCRTWATCLGAAAWMASQPASVSTTNAPRGSSSHGSRATRPRLVIRGDLMGEAGLLPVGGGAELEDPQPAARGLGEVREDHVVGDGQPGLALQLPGRPGPGSRRAWP